MTCRRLQINAFVKANTNGRVSSVLTQSELARVDVGLLINVVFFKVRHRNVVVSLQSIRKLSSCGFVLETARSFSKQQCTTR